MINLPISCSSVLFDSHGDRHRLTDKERKARNKARKQAKASKKRNR